MAHVVQQVGKWFAISFAPEVRIAGRFVELLAVQVMEPRLDTAPRNHNENRIGLSKSFDAPYRALLLKLRSTSFRRFRVGICDRDQDNPTPVPNPLQLVWELFTHALFTGSTPSRKRKTVNPATELASKPATEEATKEHVRLRVLTEQDHGYAHRSQPRATTSE